MTIPPCLVSAAMRSRLPVTFGQEKVDRYRALTLLTLAGIAGALALRIFGLPQVDLHSPLHYLGLMDPLCGMTRAVRALVLGDIGSALEYNPASLALALGAVLVMTRTTFGLIPTNGYRSLSRDVHFGSLSWSACSRCG